MQMLPLCAALAATLTTAYAQSPIVGLQLRGTDTLFTSTTNNFVNDFVVGAALVIPSSIFAIDFDASATDLWAVVNDTAEYGLIDQTTGVFTPNGVANFPLDFVNGLTASPDGNTWYVVGQTAAGDAELWVGDITTGTFTVVGIVAVAEIIIDIACDSQGNLWGMSISTDTLWTIDSTTAVGTLVGGHGLAANFAQGFDIDWSNDAIYATIYTGGGTGMFCELSPIDGSIVTSEDTVGLNAEMEMAVQIPAGGQPAIGMSYCSPANANSTGNPASIMAFGSDTASDNNVTLTASGLPNNQFGFFINSLTQGLIQNPGGSQGNLCVIGSIGRYNAQIFNSGAIGEGSITLDLTMTPIPTGIVSIMAGETWNFQAWHRDLNPTPTSNFTDAVSVTFQ